MISNTPVGIRINGNAAPNADDVSGTLLLDNVKANGVGALVADASGATILPGGDVSSWGRGSRYTDDSGTGSYETGNLPNVQKSGSLLDGAGNFFEKGRPQYENLGANDFASVKGNIRLLKFL
jgi:hypothetical protein